MFSANKYINEKTVSHELKQYYKFIANKGSIWGIVNIIRDLTKDFEDEEKEVFYSLALNNMSHLLTEKINAFAIPEV